MSQSSRENLLSQLKKIKHIALDMDGTIYNGNTLFPFTVPFLKSLREMGISYTFLTNNPSKSTGDCLADLHQMGIEAEKSELYTSAQATIDYIKMHYTEVRKLFILGTDSMIKEFESSGFISVQDDAREVPDMLVVGFDKSLVYSRLCRSAWWASEGIPYVATNPDRVCPTDEPTVWVDCGAIYACIAYATGRNPDVVIGKPNSFMLRGVLSRYQLEANEVAMVGDRIYTDIKMAENSGALGVLVLSGETTLDVVKLAKSPPQLVVENIAEFAVILKKAKKQMH